MQKIVLLEEEKPAHTEITEPNALSMIWTTLLEKNWFTGKPYTRTGSNLLPLDYINRYEEEGIASLVWC